MKKYLVIPILCLVSAVSIAWAQPKLRPASWATQVVGSELENFYKVSDKLYRSEQPDEESFVEIESFGISSILNLRNNHSDDEEAEQTKLVLNAIKMNAGSVTQADIIQSLKVIQESKGPVLVHCWHGSDRTGVVVASYRIAVQNWSKQEAIDEFVNGGYGYHSSFYPNLIELLENLNVDEIKNQLGLVTQASKS